MAPPASETDFSVKTLPPAFIRLLTRDLSCLPVTYYKKVGFALASAAVRSLH
jgi:hypothetical protein